ncbi:hypothetical protein pb186bvf_012273 [Paramecium bursaria]
MNNFPNNNPPQFNAQPNALNLPKPINSFNPGGIPQMNQGAQAGQQPFPFKPINNPPQGQQIGSFQGQQMNLNPIPTQQGIQAQPNRLGIPQGNFNPAGIQSGLGIQPVQGIQSGIPGGIKNGPVGPIGQGIQPKGIGIGGPLKPVEHKVQPKENLDLTRDPEQIIQEITKFINNPIENDIPNIINGVIQLCRDNIDLQLTYFSSRFCSITGKNFENDNEILAVQNQTPVYGITENDRQYYNFDGLYFNIHEFISRIVINGILDYSIDEIDIILWNNQVKRFCFDIVTLQRLFGGEEGLQKKFEEASRHFKQGPPTLFECPLLKTKFSEELTHIKQSNNYTKKEGLLNSLMKKQSQN